MQPEPLEIVDAAGNMAGVAPRSQVHREGFWHRAVSVLLFRSDGRLILQRRQWDKDVCPGAWDLSVAEHLRPGETYEQAAIRGLQEELGVVDVVLEPVGGVTPVRLEIAEKGVKDFELQQAFRGIFDGEVRPDAAEVCEVGELTLSEHSIALSERSGELTPWLRDSAVRLGLAEPKKRVAPKGLLVDYGGTLVEEIGFDVRAGNEWLLAQAAHRPPNLSIDDVLARAGRVASRREHVHIEAPWPMLTRLIHDFLGVRFDAPMQELELGFWKAAAHTAPIPGARRALERFRACGIPVGVVSNSSFGSPVIRYELDKRGLADHLAFVLVSAEYAVRKPNPMLFETAGARLGVAPSEIWFVGDRLDADAAGARAAGMTAVWFNPHRREDAARVADVTVGGWDELAERSLPDSAT